MRPKLLIALAAALALAGCAESYDVPAPNGEHLATCYEAALQAFCQVAQPPGTAVVTGTPKASGTAQILMGLGVATMGAGFAAGH
jgi:hypothetical protein